MLKCWTVIKVFLATKSPKYMIYFLNTKYNPDTLRTLRDNACRWLSHASLTFNKVQDHSGRNQTTRFKVNYHNVNFTKNWILSIQMQTTINLPKKKKKKKSPRCFIKRNVQTTKLLWDLPNQYVRTISISRDWEVCGLASADNLAFLHPVTQWQ